MARVLMCWEFGTGLPYIEGLTAIARWGKQHSKHEFLFALRNLKHAERLLGGKFAYYQAPTTVGRTPLIIPAPMTFADVLINLGFAEPGPVTSRVRAWRGLFDLLKPDVVRCGNAPGALLAARGTGIRTIASGIGFISPPSISPLPKVRSWNTDAKPERMAAREELVLTHMNQALDAIGAPRVTSVGALYGDADRCELYTYPELDEYGPRDAKTVYLGNVQAAGGEVPSWPTGPGKRIFAYLDPNETIQPMLQALAASGQPVLVYLPNAPEALRQQYASGNLRITDRPVDVPKAAAQCDIGVNNGGHNIVASLLQAGKPQICLPILFPQRVTAEKLVQSGAALMSQWQPTDLSQNLARLLQEPAFTLKAQEIGRGLTKYTLEYALKGSLESVELLAKRRS